jgi:hypothetical protein
MTIIDKKLTNIKIPIFAVINMYIFVNKKNLKYIQFYSF